MERKITLRALTPSDLEGILAVQVASPGAAAWTRADYASLLDDETTVGLLAEDRVEGRAVGFVLARMVSEEMEILNLAVAAAYRRRGIGRRLLVKLLARARGPDIGQCWLEVRASNRAARDFYRSLGFVETFRRLGYYRHPSEDAVVCVRRLTGARPLP